MIRGSNPGGPQSFFSLPLLISLHRRVPCQPTLLVVGNGEVPCLKNSSRTRKTTTNQSL